MTTPRSGKRAVFLDRDGVLNRAIVRNGKPYPPASAEELEITPGAAHALERLKRRGFLLVVVTNQPDIARGTQSAAQIDSIHSALAKRLPLDAFFTCPHDDGDNCHCRKPKPGLLRDAASSFHVNLSSSYMVGDRWRDVDAGRSAGCRTVWIDCGYTERPPSEPPDAIVQSLPQAVDWILRTESVSQR